MDDIKDKFDPDMPNAAEGPGIQCTLRPLEDSTFALFMELTAEIAKRSSDGDHRIPRPNELNEETISEFYRMYLEFFSKMPPGE